MRPQEFWPKRQDLNNLLLRSIYLVERIMGNPEIQKRGVSFLADMSDWTEKNFSATYAYRWFSMVQHSWPLAIRSFLMVGTPSWFGDIWRVNRPMILKSSANKWKFTIRQNNNLVIDSKYLPADSGSDNFEDSYAFLKQRYTIENKYQYFYSLGPGLVADTQ